MSPQNDTTEFFSLASLSLDFTMVQNLTAIRRYRSLSGLSPHVTQQVWRMLLINYTSLQPVNLFEALFFLKCYPTESASCSIWKRVEKTIRKWAWLTLRAISDLLPVSVFKNFPNFILFLFINFFWPPKVGDLTRQTFWECGVFWWVLRTSRWNWL